MAAFSFELCSKTRLYELDTLKGWAYFVPSGKGSLLNPPVAQSKFTEGLVFQH